MDAGNDQDAWMNRLDSGSIARLTTSWISGIVVFRAGIAAASRIARIARFSTSSRMASRAFGTSAVCVSGAAAGFTFEAVDGMEFPELEFGQGCQDKKYEKFGAEQFFYREFGKDSDWIRRAIGYGFASWIVYFTMGGRSLMCIPADVRIVGPFAKKGVAVAQYGRPASAQDRRIIQAIGSRFGCHHCGRKISDGEKYTADHQPPTGKRALFADMVRMRLRHLKLVLWKFLGISKKDVNGVRGIQMLYPQCRPCSDLQAIAVREGKHLRSFPAPGIRAFQIWLPIPVYRKEIIQIIEHLYG